MADDGIGGVAPAGGVGLRSLADRVDVLGGKLAIHSPAGEGTRVLVELPCQSIGEDRDDLGRPTDRPLEASALMPAGRGS